MIFPFAEYRDRSVSTCLGETLSIHVIKNYLGVNNFVYALFRFQTQTQLYGSKPSDFRLSIEEALLVENGHTKSDFNEGHEDNPIINHSTIQEATASNRDIDYYSFNKASCDITIIILCLLLLWGQSYSCTAQLHKSVMSSVARNYTKLDK